MNKTISLSVKANTVFGYLIAFGIGVIFGFRAINDVVGFLFLFAGFACFFFAFQLDIVRLFSWMPYLIYTEMFTRIYISAVPYLFMQYFFIGIFLVLIVRNTTRVQVHSRAFIFLLLYIVVEFVNSTRSSNPDIARGLLINSVALAVASMWASFNFFTPAIVNKILVHVKYASIYLCGIIIARYIWGDVTFSSHSASEGTNGLAPVQLSGYLGFSCCVFFFSIMNAKLQKEIVLNIICFSVCLIMMLLSFSRGGIYFVAAVTALYFFFNRTMVKSYLLLLMVVPFSLLAYYYVEETTNGMIADRYEQEGTSGRDELVKAGIALFKGSPLAGVGLGNFSTEINERNLYGVESGAHNEFIRVAAEDGILGIFTYWTFFAVLFYEIMKRKKIQRDYAIYFLVLYCLISVHNGLKISIQPFLIVLAIATPTIVNVKKKRENVSYSANAALTSQ